MNSNDTLIIQTLAHVGCPVNNDMQLKDMSTEVLFCSVAQLLNLIQEEHEESEPFPISWPTSVSVRYNLGIRMAKAIEELGYSSSDIGYQTFLHKEASNLKDLSLIFIFLIEKLPVQSSLLIQDNKSKTAEAVSSKLKSEPSQHRNSSQLERVKDILSPEAFYSLSQHLFSERKTRLASALKSMQDNNINERSILHSLQSHEENLKQDIKTKQKKRSDLKGEIKDLASKLEEIDVNTKETEKIISLTEDSIETLKKVNHVLKDESSIAKLSDLIEKRRSKRKVLQKQWEDGARPLEAEFEELVNKLRDLRRNDYLQNLTFKSINAEIQEVEESLKAKELKLATKVMQYDQMMIGNSRSFYTDKILDLNSKIKDRSMVINDEIESLKSLQKDINSSTSQLDRTFTETESRLFSVAVEDTNMISGYKILIKWYNVCNDLMKDMRSVGRIQREIQDLQRRIQRENLRDFAGKIERVKNDISIMSKENAELLMAAQ